MWWHDAVIYQIYIRSFQDSDGDGVGDLAGIISRLDHIESLGAAAIWISPPYPSPNADFGYDVTDYTAVDPAYGTLQDFDRLLKAAHERDLRVLLDFVPAHTSIEHPWFRARPSFYFWADTAPNNWRDASGGPAWQRDPETGRYYLHTFSVQQPDLNWRNPEVRAEIGKALRFWLDRGVDGFRLDAVQALMKDRRLRDDPPATDPSVLPLQDEYGRLSHVNSANAPDIGVALRAIRQAAGDSFLVGEAYVPTDQLQPYTQTLDLVFAFEPMNVGPDAKLLETTIAAAHATGKVAWVLSNHDFTRFATRFGASFRAAALLFLSLPGPAFVYQGDELGMIDGPGVDPPQDQVGRDRYRHPMQWDPSPGGGFTTGAPWLPPIDPQRRNVAEQGQDPESALALFRRVIRLRGGLGPGLRFLASPGQTVMFQRGNHLIAANFGRDPAPVIRTGELVLEARRGDGQDPGFLPAGGGWIARV